MKKHFDDNQFRAIGHQLIDRLADHLEECQNNNRQVSPGKSAQAMHDMWQTHFDAYHDSDRTADPMALFSDIIKYSLALHHPHNMGHQLAVPLPVTALAALLSAFLNNQTSLYEVAPVANTMEALIVRYLLKRFNFPAAGGGFFVSGGSLANLTALLAARQACSDSDVFHDGVRKQKPFVVLASEHAHYCIKRAVQIMGLGAEGYIAIPADKHGRLRMDCLSERYYQAVEADKQIMAVVGVAGITATGAFDPVHDMAEFCKQHGLWYHVDAAYGGGVIFSEQYRHLITGIEQADSMVFNFHKMLAVPSPSSTLLFRRETDAWQTFSQQASYLWSSQQDAHEKRNNFIQQTIECSKSSMSMIAYTLLTCCQSRDISDYIECQFSLAKSFANIIDAHREFQLAIKPICNIVCFRYYHGEVKDLNALNERLRRHVVVSGRYYIVQTKIDEIVYLRVALMNPLTDINHCQSLLDYLIEVRRTYVD